ncbi:MAG: exodeoxyribonuclease VII large subunit [Erysipelotrichaceae bacterium]|nr:exodeoxyribonuclease VII large subunit [Erysipelotrichaceae bacterium]
MSQRVISVSQLVRYLKSKLDNDPLIQRIMIEGEISNFTAHRSGHWYFSLKDHQSRISCVMFQTYVKAVKFFPKNGDKVIVSCSTSMFESAGSVQLYCTSMKPSGVGDLYVQLELLKQKLRSEGLFDVQHKKMIPAYPMRIGVIVGANTAAREDIMTTLKRRWPVAQIVEFHSLVQGDTAHLELISAILRADQSNCDVLILARGGGSIEDLWAFNNEDLARYIFQLNTPIVTGIGHEIDFTIADFVADVRAATPTAAAETVSPDIAEVLLQLSQYSTRLLSAINRKLDIEKLQLDSLSQRSVLQNADMLLHRKQMVLDYLNSQLIHAMESQLNQAQKVRSSVVKCSRLMSSLMNTQLNTIQKKKQKMISSIQLNVQKQSLNVKHEIQSLDAYSPLKILLRGYSIATHNQQTVTSIHQVEKEDILQLRVSDGHLTCRVEQKGELS